MMFFFSSRRRHTIWPRDWSSDVCSSDLGQDAPRGGCVDCRAELPPGLGQQLALEDVITYLHQRLGGLAHMLAQGQYEPGRKARLGNGQASGLGLVLGGLDAAVKAMQDPHAARPRSVPASVAISSAGPGMG